MSMTKRLPAFIFGLLLTMCVVLGIALLVGEVTPKLSHLQYAAMDRSDPALQETAVAWLGWVLGVLEIVFFVSCLVLGVGRRARGKRVFLLGGLVYAAVFTALTVTDAWYMEQDAPTLVLSFPVPTAWMLYGMWAAPLIFMAWYWIGFDRNILTPEDMETFRGIVQDRRNREEEES